MRRFFCLTIVLLLAMASCGLAEQQNPYAAILDAVDALQADDVKFMEAGDWMSVRLQKKMQVVPLGEVLQIDGRVFDQNTAELIQWDDLFEDGDAAAAWLEALAAEATYDNAYSEYNEISPMPRDSFTVADGLLTVYYPARQLSHFSGQSGAFSFYTYELDGFLKEGVPLVKGNPEEAAAGREETLAEGALPGPLKAWKLGGAMKDAAEALSLVDVPDLTYDYAVYRFEAPEMRGVSLLSTLDQDRAESAVIAGIMAEHIDFYGLCPGMATKDECVAALGEPDATVPVETADAYSRLPVGETLQWMREGRALELHFVDGTLQSVTLRTN